MTGKSPPIRKSLQFRFLLLANVVCCTVGCSTFSVKQSSLSEFEEARQQIENPDGVYRPEGVSAESDGFGSAFFEKLGLQSKARRDIEVARGHYASADALFAEAKTLEGEERAKLFRDAAKEYELAAENWQSSGLEQDALLMAAESHFFAEDYYEAENLYANLVKEYPRNPYLDHVDSRRFEIADYWLRFDHAKPVPFLLVNLTDNRLPWNDTGGHGKRVLEKMRLDNPTGKIGDDATMRLAMEHYENGKFEDAVDTFADLRMTYPDSEHQFNAQMLELESLLASYQGHQYSSIPLTDAQKRIEQITKQFPTESAEHREALQTAYAKIRFSMAERIWYQAKYRRSRSENGSAKFHFTRILEEYGDTPFAEQAQEGLDELKDAPDSPPQRFKALVWLFGGPKDERPWRDKTSTDLN